MSDTELYNEPEYEIESWERQDGETKREFAAFLYYWGMGEGRSFVVMHKELKAKGSKLSIAYLRQMAEYWEWSARVIAKNVHEWRKDQERRDRELDEMDSRHIAIATAMQSKVVQALNAAENLTQDELVKYLSLSSGLERKVRK